MRLILISIIVIVVCAGLLTGCSGPTQEALAVKDQAMPVVKAFIAFKDADDDYDKFVAEKGKWEEKTFDAPQAEALRKKLVQYLDMRIGAINGAPMLAANKTKSEFEQMVKEVEKSLNVKFR